MIFLDNNEDLNQVNEEETLYDEMNIPEEIPIENYNEDGAYQAKSNKEIQKERNIVPIEVKAEGNLRSQSLKAYCEKFHPNMAVRLSALKYKEQDWMINLPLYAVCNL